MRIPVPPHPWEHLLLSVFWILAILIGVWWYLIAVLICSSLIANDSEYFFHIWTCHLCIFFGKIQNSCLFRSFAHFKKFCCLFSYCWILRVLCVFWITVLYQRGLLQIFSFRSVACLPILFIPSFAEQRFLILMKSSLSNFFMICDFGLIFERSLSYPRSSRFTHIFFP